MFEVSEKREMSVAEQCEMLQGWLERNPDYQVHIVFHVEESGNGCRIDMKGECCKKIAAHVLDIINNDVDEVHTV